MSVLVIFFFSLPLVSRRVISGDATALLSLKSSIDPANSLPWRGIKVCHWRGVKECVNGRVTKLVIEHENLTGTLRRESLSSLNQLRVLSMKANSISGEIPDLSPLRNLKSLYLNKNNFSGNFPNSLASLRHLKIIVLSGNQISGEIPATLVKLRPLYILCVENNKMTGTIPPLNQSNLKFLNLSNNQFSGSVPATPALMRFNISSFFNNRNLCGLQVRHTCRIGEHDRNKARTQQIKIIAGSAGVVVILLICLVIILSFTCKTIARRRNDTPVVSPAGSPAYGERVLFIGGDGEYRLEELLRSSAEVLGRGRLGNTYKAVMESGNAVAVKRLRGTTYPTVEDFQKHVEIIGSLRHPNLVPLRAYFHAEGERLLVYDYYPNGSLYTLIYGPGISSGGKPLHWTSCVKIAEDVASGLLYLHQNGVVHGRMTSSNILLGPDFESCVADYGLAFFVDPSFVPESSGFSAFVAPECRDDQNTATFSADVYCFGVLLLELLTGKMPFSGVVDGGDVREWVRSVREEEADSGDDPSSGGETSGEKLGALINVAMACVSHLAERRLTMVEVLKLVRETRGETLVSSNGSDRSQGRWSDSIQSLRREGNVSM